MNGCGKWMELYKEAGVEKEGCGLWKATLVLASKQGGKLGLARGRHSSREGGGKASGPAVRVKAAQMNAITAEPRTFATSLLSCNRCDYQFHKECHLRNHMEKYHRKAQTMLF